MHVYAVAGQALDEWPEDSMSRDAWHTCSGAVPGEPRSLVAATHARLEDDDTWRSFARYRLPRRRGPCARCISKSSAGSAMFRTGRRPSA
jgi:hypothetical protein